MSLGPIGDGARNARLNEAGYLDARALENLQRNGGFVSQADLTRADSALQLIEVSQPAGFHSGGTQVSWLNQLNYAQNLAQNLHAAYNQQHNVGAPALGAVNQLPVYQSNDQRAQADIYRQPVLDPAYETQPGYASPAYQYQPAYVAPAYDPTLSVYPSYANPNLYGALAAGALFGIGFEALRHRGGYERSYAQAFNPAANYAGTWNAHAHRGGGWVR